MARMVKHLALLGLSLPAAMAGYHLAEGRGAGDHHAEVAQRRIADAVHGLGLGDSHDLGALELLERSFYYVEQRYVEKDRLDTEAMFQASLDLVERRVNEVMFQREPRGRRLQVSVGSYTTVLLVEPIEGFDDLNRELRRVAKVLDAHLSDEVDRPDVEYALINGALSVLDPHSVLLPPDAARDMKTGNQGEFGGLGIQITTRDGRLTVQDPLDGSPAYEAGLKAGDQIIRIEDESTINMDLGDAVERLRGEVGTPVNILVSRETLPKPKRFTIIRGTIPVDRVEGELLDGDVGYVRISSFNRNASSQLDELLAAFKRDAPDGLQGLVLDLRGNPGGFLQQAYEISNRFLDDGVIVSTVEGASRRRDEQRATRPGTEPDYPIAVLVNASSASASEIVAGALRNQERAVIIGERSFGKGSVQHLYENRDDSSLKLTVAKYLTPGDHSIQSVGISPDIALEPTIVRPAEGTGQPVVTLFWREWVDREASLERHLDDGDGAPGGGAAFRVRYLKPDLDDDEREVVRNDWEVGFAREVLLTARAARRADVLRAAAPVVERTQRRQAEEIEAAFAGIALDWEEGWARREEPALRARLDLGDDGVLRAGEEEMVAIELTNDGTEPLHRITAVTESDNPWLNHREFFFGRIEPGETLRYEQRVALQAGYGSEIAPVTIRFRDAEGDVLGTSEALAQTVGDPLPRFSYSLVVVDDGSGESSGDGDGRPELGEVVELEVTVTNIGGGPARSAYARLRSESRKALDLRKGRLRLGTPQLADGTPCDDLDEQGCDPVLEPGQSATGRFAFELRANPLQPDADWRLELQVGDNERFDHATVQRGGFYDYFHLTEALRLTPGQPLAGHTRTPPEIAVTRAPELRAASPAAVISGLITDDRGIRDVMIFHGEEKVFYRGGQPETVSIPFTADPTLEPGSNMLYVLARDHEGLSATWSVHTWLEEAATTAQALPAPAPPTPQ